MWKVDDRPPATYDAPGFDEPGVRSLFYDGPAWQGRPTRVFAWLGMPAQRGAGPVPGIVLVHGGGGSAFAHWVRLWNERGYAAIAMDTCGHTPDAPGHRRDHHPLGGPPGWGAYDRAFDPPTEQWGYHAVEAILRGHSLLRAQPGVDPKRIGMTGISWGGVLTAIAAGHDPRFRFAAPVYGCGFLQDSPGLGLDAADPKQAARWSELWDPSRHLKAARMPFLWVNGTNDFAFTPPMWQASHRLPGGRKTLSLKLRMPHAHPPGETPEEIRVFADSLCRGGEPLPRLSRLERRGTTLRARVNGKAAAAELLFTRHGEGAWPQRLWETLPARLSADARSVSAELPDGFVAAHLNVTDARGCVVSSEWVGVDG